MTPKTPAGSAPGEDALRDELIGAADELDRMAAFAKTKGPKGAVWVERPGELGSLHRRAAAALATLLASKEAAEREAGEAKANYDAAALARDEAGYLGTVADCIRGLNEDTVRLCHDKGKLFDRAVAAEAERDALARMVGEMSAELAKTTARHDALQLHLDSCAKAADHSPIMSYPVATSVSRLAADRADLKARIAGLEAHKRYETDARGARVWVVWAISEKSAQLAGICSSEAEALHQIKNIPALYPECWFLHERAPVDHTFGEADLKALHWRSALAGARRVRGDARAALTKDTPDA